MAKQSLKYRIQKMDIGINIILFILVLLTFYPFMAMLFMSLKDNPQFIHARWVPTLPLHFENYAYAWKAVGQFVLNSIFVSSVSAIGGVFFAALSAYVFARFQFPGKTVLYMLIISLMMIPGVLTLVPQFLLVRDLKLLDTYWVLILPYLAGAQPFGIMLLRTFFEGLPHELFESARLDGANELSVMRNIAIPLSMPIIGTLMIMNVTGTWNDVLWPSVTISNVKLKTIVFGLWSFQSQYYSSWGPLNAAYTISAIPLIIMFAFTSRLFVQGLTSGALKV
ncbi:MAG: carbohydrate ABC transporter permease [Chloroflexi bacterium]|nr:carbohydrate ABC transporter permease [Chloroflexota bacterium]